MRIETLLALLLVVLLPAACTCSKRPSAASATAGGAPAKSSRREGARSKGRTSQRELTWRVLESDVDVKWHRTANGMIHACWPPKPCRDYSERAFLAEVARRSKKPAWTVHGTRPIDKLFWALGQLKYLYDDELEVVADDPAKRRQLDQLIAWLAARYGFTVVAPIATHYKQASDKDPIVEGDLRFGVFVSKAGKRWQCARDAPPGKYCCYVYCKAKDDSMAEGH